VDLLHRITLAALAAALVAWLVWSARRDPQVVAGKAVLRYPVGLRIAYGIGCLVCLAILAWLWREIVHDRVLLQLFPWAWLAIPFVAALAVACVLEARVALQFDERGIRGRTAFRGHREIEWQAVVGVRWSPLYQWFVLRDREGRTLRVSRFLRGHEAALTALQTFAPEGVGHEALARFRGGC
jgi:hypothetical protein